MAEPVSGHRIASQMSDDMQMCIDNCTECHNMCEETLAYCIEQGGPHTEASHLRTLMDCAQTCTTSANLMLLNSDLHAQMCGVCAEACDRCAQSCDTFGNDPQMKECADTCRQCAQSCHQMAGMHHMAM